MNSFSRRRLLGAAAALATVSVVGAEAWAQAKDRLVIGMSLEPPVLDPTKNAASAVREVTSPGIFESLGRIDLTGAIAPGVAQSWSISEDGKEYLFKLRSGVKFHDGSDFTAADVKFSIERIPTVSGPNPTTIYVLRVKETKIIDPPHSFGDGQLGKDHLCAGGQRELGGHRAKSSE